LLSKQITMPYAQESLSAMAEDGIKLAAEVCLRTENYIARR